LPEIQHTPFQGISTCHQVAPKASETPRIGKSLPGIKEVTTGYIIPGPLRQLLFT
jgi:hypothetical protein